MKIVSAGKPTSSPTKGAPIAFIVWDFLKMFTAAIVYGVCISLLASGIALFLAADPEAERLADARAYRLTSKPPASSVAPDGAELQNPI